METSIDSQLGEVIRLHGHGYDPDPELGMTDAAIKNRRDQIIAERTRVFFPQLVLHGNAIDTVPDNVIPFPSSLRRS